jgi:molybdate-binding protein/DNA-binding transcriptional regulator YhcF (GntR family)
VIEFRFTKGRPEYLQIAEQVQLAVASGRLHPHDRLEPVRELAGRLGLNPSTVARAYRVLAREGVIETGGRRGSRVAAAGPGDAGSAGELRRARLRALVSRAVLEGLAQGYSTEELEAALGLELAAWRERREEGGPACPPVADAGRLNRFAGSHDLALEALWAQTRRRHPEVAVEPRYVGSLDGLLALLHGEAALAGAHLLDEESGEYNLPVLRRLFIGVPLCVVTLAEREQGLIVGRGNPQGIGGFADLMRVSIVNRQVGSGTRTLLDHHLHRLGLAAGRIAGYDRAASTHLAVAAAVADGSADAGLGIRAAARAFDLEFLPLARERYDLVLAAADRERSPLSEILTVLGSAEFRAVAAQIGGYDTARTGEERRL